MKASQYQTKMMIILLSAVVLIAGCSGSLKQVDTTENSLLDEDGASGAADSERFADFMLGVGDAIEISVYRKKTPEHIIGVGDSFEVTVYRKETSEFVLGQGDSVDIAVYRNSDLNKTVHVTTDGNITMPLIGDLKVAGKTLTEMRNSLQKQLARYIVDPQVSVSLENKQGFTIDKLSLTFTVSAYNKGKVLFPTIGEIRVAGLKVDELEKELEKRLAEFYFEPVVDINVAPLANFKVDELSASMKIDATGKIIYPLLGDIQAAGKEVYVLRDEIRSLLGEYIDDPQVAVNVTAVASQEFHVLGEVEMPGVFALSRKTLAWEAISRAGGFTNDARKGQVLLVRNVAGNATVTALDLNVKHMLMEGQKYLRRGDVLYVPPKFIASLERFMARLNTILSPIISIERGIVLEPDVESVLRGEGTSESSVDRSF
jgi:polysaccharide biosynthesis/export protein